MEYKLHHAAISVRDLDESIGFYIKLGFKEVHRYTEEDRSLEIAHLKLENNYLEIFGYKENKDAPLLIKKFAGGLKEIGLKHIALETDDIEKALSDIKQKGLADKDKKITYGRTKVSHFFINDPDGNSVEIIKDDRY